MKRLKGEGMPIHGVPSEFGDLHVKLTVKMPTELTPEQQKVLEEIL